jgi:hypothetical protein
MMLLQLALCFSNAVKSECPLHFHLANMCTPCLFVYLNYKSNYMYMHGICWLLELAEYKKDGWYFGYVSSVSEKRQRKSCKVPGLQKL